MRIVDARAMPIDHEDVIAVTSSSVYYREKVGRTTFSLYRFDEENAAVTQLNRHPYEDYGYAKLFVDRDIVYFLNEIPDGQGVIKTELIAFSYEEGTEEVLTMFEKRGNSTLFWVLDNRYFLFLTTFESSESDEAWLYDRVTGQRERIRDERLVGKTERFRELYLFTTNFNGVPYIVCNARLDEFDYYDALDNGRISPDDPIDHSEALLICTLDEVVEAIWDQQDELPFDDILRLHGEGDTVQYLGDNDGILRFSAFVDALNEEVIYDLTAPDVLHEVSVVDWGAYEPLDFTYDDIGSTIFIKVDESDMHTEVIDITTGARYIDVNPFERVISQRYLVHEYTDGLTSGVILFDLELEERFAYENAYFMVIDDTILILSMSSI
ncbi:hypothetical protein PTI97_07160 [Exiguobacterium marinum]|uniref:Uncharacterized protein n=1 Tax=Exiguobacterium marinum TaxID=273528 RepID=A0ABY7X2F4_9BACL|nr:hypothetical protein [Exiguobacterium marinum]WDH77289.1 hypothetical protein PTI97_07160 [Exiguobacterium marinum]